jgi:hypothetical protein
MNECMNESGGLVLLSVLSTVLLLLDWIPTPSRSLTYCRRTILEFIYLCISFRTFYLLLLFGTRRLGFQTPNPGGRFRSSRILGFPRPPTGIFYIPMRPFFLDRTESVIRASIVFVIVRLVRTPKVKQSTPRGMLIHGC